MYTHCKPGDLAVIIREEIGCEKNIGKIVEIRGPIRMNDIKGPQWLIRSANVRGHWHFRSAGTGTLVRVRRGLHWHDRVDHPDAWMVPILGADVADGSARHVVQGEREVTAPKTLVASRRHAEGMPARTPAALPIERG